MSYHLIMEVLSAKCTSRCCDDEDDRMAVALAVSQFLQWNDHQAVVEQCGDVVDSLVRWLGNVARGEEGRESLVPREYLETMRVNVTQLRRSLDRFLPMLEEAIKKETKA